MYHDTTHGKPEKKIRQTLERNPGPRSFLFSELREKGKRRQDKSRGQERGKKRWLRGQEGRQADASNHKEEKPTQTSLRKKDMHDKDRGGERPTKAFSDGPKESSGNVQKSIPRLFLLLCPIPPHPPFICCLPSPQLRLSTRRAQGLKTVYTCSPHPAACRGLVAISECQLQLAQRENWVGPHAHLSPPLAQRGSHLVSAGQSLCLEGRPSLQSNEKKMKGRFGKVEKTGQQ